MHVQMYNESEQTIQEDSFSHRKNRNEIFDAKSVCGLIAPRYKSGSSRTFASSFLFIRKEECLVDRRVAASKAKEKGVVATATFALSRKL